MVPYLAVPFVEKGRDRDGLDCWGLVRLVLREQCGVELPAYYDAKVCPREIDEVGRLIAGAVESPIWHEVDAPRAFDVLTFSLGPFRHHVGLYVAKELFLHAKPGAGVCVDRLFGMWRQGWTGTYRHEELLP